MRIVADTDAKLERAASFHRGQFDRLRAFGRRFFVRERHLIGIAMPLFNCGSVFP